MDDKFRIPGLPGSTNPNPLLDSVLTGRVAVGRLDEGIASVGYVALALIVAHTQHDIGRSAAALVDASKPIRMRPH